MTHRRDDEQLPMARTPSVDDDVRKEIAFHLHERVREFESRGVPHDRALVLAKESFGDSAAVEAECKAIERRRRTSKKRSDRLDALWQDVRVGVRVLIKSPAFTAAAIITLALGIGATAAVFSIVNRIVLQPLPYAGADRLAWVLERHANDGQSSLSFTSFLELERDTRAFDAMTQYGSGTTTILSSSGPIRARAAWVSQNFFRVFPVRPFMGRLPAPGEHREGAAAVAVVSYAFWRDVLGAPKSLDRVRVRLSMEHAVIGVLPPDFDYPAGNQVWRPMELQSQSTSHTSHNWSTVGRLRAGVTPSAAQRDLDGLLRRMRGVYYPDFDAIGSAVTSLQDAIAGPVKTPLYLLLGASGILLLAACTNLASSMLARGTARGSEFALRSALGATRVRLVRQLLTESALLAVVGCVAGLALAWVMLRVISPFAPANLRMSRVHVDGWVQAFALITAVMTTVLFGLVPALRLSDTNTTIALREAGGPRSGTAGKRRMLAWNFLVGAEVALAVMLFAGSTLLIKSFSKVMATDLGFSAASVTTVTVDLPAINYGDTSARVAEFHERALASIKRLRGVTSVGFVNVLPLQGANPNGAMQVEGKPLNPRGPFSGFSIYRVVGRGYFAALGMPIIKGRDFNDGDSRTSAPVVIVNETFAKQEWPGENPLGKRVKVAGMDTRDEDWRDVIGVVGDSRASSVTEPFSATYFFDYRQRPMYRSRSVSYAVRTTAAPAAVVPAVREALRAIDPNVPIVVQPMSEIVSRAVADRRFTVLVLGGFAGVALLLAIVGIYGVVSYAVAQRTREIGVRRALGATDTSVHGLVLRSSMQAVIPGLVAGLLLAAGGGLALRSLLYGVSPYDAPVLAIAVVVLGVAAIFASVIPAFRATRVDPMVAMRAD